MFTNRRRTLQLLAAAAAAPALPALAHDEHDDRDDDDGHRAHRAFTLSNATGGNELLVYATSPAGVPTPVARLATQGLGSGGGLGSQGAVTLSGDGRHLFVVNAASNTVSTFVVRRREVRLVSVVDSGGLRPVSVAEHDGLVYVLNVNGDGNVAGFRNEHGELRALPGSTRALSAAGGTAAAQVGFGSDGDVLLVTERATNRLTSWRVGRDGRLGAPVITASAGITPFGFAFDRRNRLFVSEAAGGAVNGSTTSSYRFDDDAPARPLVVSPAVATTQTAACWLVVTANGRYAYTANAGSSSVSSFRIGKGGRIELAQAVAASTGAGAGASDMALSSDGRRLFVLSGGNQRVNVFGVAADGTLEPLGAAGGFAPGAVGMAAH